MGWVAWERKLWFFRALATLLPHPAATPNLVCGYFYQDGSSLSKIVKDDVILNRLLGAVGRY